MVPARREATLAAATAAGVAGSTSGGSGSGMNGSGGSGVDLSRDMDRSADELEDDLAAAMLGSKAAALGEHKRIGAGAAGAVKLEPRDGDADGDGCVPFSIPHS